jgi:hypothetical protein
VTGGVVRAVFGEAAEAAEAAERGSAALSMNADDHG